MPELGGALGWLNSAADQQVTAGRSCWSTSGRTCINSLRPLPYIKAWAEKYKDAGSS
jgi:hypothetical protein